MAVGGRAVAAAGLLLAASTVTAGVAPEAPALAKAPVAAEGQEAAPRSVATETEPLVGDFDGDRRDDLLWYGPGAAEDHLWLGRPSRNFVGVAQTVRGSYQPLVGDFDGDRRADVLWYGPGGSPDVLAGPPGGPVRGPHAGGPGRSFYWCQGLIYVCAHSSVRAGWGGEAATMTV